MSKLICFQTDTYVRVSEIAMVQIIHPTEKRDALLLTLKGNSMSQQFNFNGTTAENNAAVKKSYDYIISAIEKEDEQ